MPRPEWAALPESDDLKDHWDKPILDKIAYDGSHIVNLHPQGLCFFGGAVTVGDELAGDGLLPGADFPGQFPDLLVLNQETLCGTKKKSL
mgnify:CR=1 FL=1